ncbi:MAG: MbcA/ParS/Xre antitoxin family protein [Candidatus Thiodiazotropha endolucinida]
MVIEKESLIKIINHKKRKLEESLNVITDQANEDIVGLTVELFDDDLNMAVNWLLSPIMALNGDAPVDRLNSDEGREYIKTIIARIQHGVFS